MSEGAEKMFAKIWELASYRITQLRDSQNPWYTGPEKYLDEMGDEIAEARAEYVPDNAVYLEDEMGDVLWDLCSGIHAMAQDGYLDADAILARCYAKFSERIYGMERGEKRSQIKANQKQRLADEHTERYGPGDSMH